MSEDLQRVVASYLWADCTYTNPDGSYPKQTILGGEEIANLSNLKDFKFQFRTLFSITEEELRGLAEALRWDNEFVTYGLYDTPFTGQEKIIRLGASNLYVSIDSENALDFCASPPVTVINYLRKLGFCLDEELANAGLVEWKEVNNG